jgi:hypothetical protein
MAIETDLSVSPYFDEGAAGLEKNYYKILFKPSVPVQVRELNELQTILQNQIEEFGDNVLKRGTIIRGCTFSFFNRYPYIKIEDLQADGAPVNISALNGKMVSSANNHRAMVLDYADGFQSTDPDTKTLYLRYVNSGDDGNSTAYTSGQVLKVQDPNYGVSNVFINIAGTGYSNSDSVVFVSAIAVTDITGTISVGTQLTQVNTGANSVVVSIDTTSYSDKTIIVLRPVTSDLTDSTKSANAWTFVAGDDILKSSSNSAVTATILETIGSGAAAVLTTDGSQRVTDISMTSFGSGYYIAPYATVRSTTGGAGVDLTAQNYSAEITVYSGANSVGFGYAFGVSDGVVYQKGYFLNVPEQTIVVSKYNVFPNNVSVGFSTSEDIIDAFEDTELLDNALGTRNFTAPGADRLRLLPELTVVNTDEAKSNVEFFSIVEFSDGVPYKQSQRTAYAVIGDEMAERTADSVGDFVTDKFLVACRSTANQALRANTFTVVVDPGTAYIDGYKVNTYGNYQFTLNKGIDTEVKNSTNVAMNYGSYVVVDNLAGSFDFSAVSEVKLYSSPKDYLTLANSTSAPYSSGTITAPTGLIGTAKIRNITYVDSDPDGTPQGSPTSKYNMYLFDIQMNPGRSFKDVKSIFYDGVGHKGVADVVLENITTAGKGSGTPVLGAVLKNTVAADKKTLDKMVFYTGFDSPLAINTVSYQYRTFDDSGTTYTLATNGVITVSLSGNEYFPYSDNITSGIERQQLLFIPLTTAYANSSAGGAGNCSIGASSNTSNVTISSTNTSFTNPLSIGDYISLSSNSTGGAVIRRITNIANGTHLTIDTGPGFTNSTATVTRAFPKYVPLPILTRDGITANTDTGKQTMKINLGTQISGVSTIPLAGAFNVSVSNAAISTKSANRDLYVKIYPANNTTGFGYSEYGTGVDGYFTSGTNAVSNTTTSAFTAGQQLMVAKAGADFLATVGTITNSTHMTLANTVNFTGNADIYAAINRNGPWCLGVPDIFRLKAVYLANTSSVNTSSADVTRDFFIDHNHNPNYADLGYLVKKKSSSLVIGPRDYLLVRFDAFTRSHEDRVVHINSYVSANSTTRANVDAKSLSQLNNSYINTFEIPEIYSPNGTDYDMINHIDFRPAAANTANLATTAAGATLNPAYSVTFSATNKKLPAPDSIMSFRTEYFLGRIDTVYMGADGRIGTARGRPYETKILNSRDPDTLLTPVPNRNTMILNHFKIPAYPSIEEYQDFRFGGVLVKGVINEKALEERNSNKRITLLLDQQEIEIEQPRRYSMEDIGNLERRIKDLEYYVSLTVLELGIKDLRIPSSVSPNINRFKFGFFADSFDSLQFTDVDSIEYAASIEKSRAVPPFETFKVEIPAPECSYSNFSVISQLKATASKVEDPPVCVNANAFVDYKTPKGQKETFITMASALANTTGRVVVYAYFYGGSLNTGPLRIFQSSVAGQFPESTAWREATYTARDTKALTSADVSYLRSIDGSTFQDGDSFKKNGTSHGVTIGDSGEPKLKRGGKIVFNHNPANGNYYKIVTDESGKIRVEYPINIKCGTGTEPGGGEPKFNGAIKVIDVDNAYRQIDKDAFSGGTETWSARFHRFHLQVTGLKPSTRHKLYFNKADLSHLCDTSIQSTVVPKPPKFSANSDSTWQSYSSQIPDFFSDSPNGQIMTDATGKIELYLYVLASESATRTEQRVEGAPYGREVYRLSPITETINKPAIEVYTVDKTSYAFVKVDMKLTVFSGFKGWGRTS